jgi:hypothetical protein
MTSHTLLRLAAVSDLPPRKLPLTVTAVGLSTAEFADDVLQVFSGFAVVLRQSYAVNVGGVVHLLPAHRGAAHVG